MSSGRRKNFWFDEDGAPQGGWVDVPQHVVDGEGFFVRDWDALGDALDTLTPKQQFVIRNSWGMVDGQEYSFRQIGEFMGVSHITVKEHYDAAMKKLRTLTN